MKENPIQKEIKIRKVDNGYFLTVIDLEADKRVPIAKYVATSSEHVERLIKEIYS